MKVAILDKLVNKRPGAILLKTNSGMKDIVFSTPIPVGGAILLKTNSGMKAIVCGLISGIRRCNTFKNQ